MPPLVVEAMRAFGIPALCYGKEPVTVVRAQFAKIFEQLAARERRLRLMPPAMRSEIAAMAAPVIKMIGVIPEDTEHATPH